MFSTNTIRQTILKRSVTTLLSPRYLRSTPLATMSTISEAIKKDHRELEEYYQEVVNNPNNHDHQQRYANQFTWELARHSIGEELVVYPAMEKFMGAEGKAKAEKDRKEHHTVKEHLKVFQNMKASDPDFISQLKSLMDDLSNHIKEEEADDLPALEAALTSSDSKDSEDLAKSFGRTKMFVPSRSHPSAGENPPFETAMGLLVAPFDHVADLFRKFPDKTISPNPSTK